jgi:hypothetical protein
VDRGIAAARRARRIEAKLYEALHWEVACQHLAGRTGDAMPLYEVFIETAQQHRALPAADRDRSSTHRSGGSGRH